jgi:hypothetical protein
MGLEGISLAIYDDPTWIGEMMKYMAEFACGCGERALRELDLDYVLLWEASTSGWLPPVQYTSTKKWLAWLRF